MLDFLSQSSLKRVLVSNIAIGHKCWGPYSNVAILFEASPGFQQVKAALAALTPPLGRNPL